MTIGIRGIKLSVVTLEIPLLPNQVYIIGGSLKSSTDPRQNNYVEVLDIRSGTISNATSGLYPPMAGGLSFSCLIPLPESNSFVMTGGEKYNAPQ